MNASEHLARVPGTRAVATAALVETRAVVAEFNDTKGVATLLGPQGTGKDFAAAVAVQLDCLLDATELAIPTGRVPEREVLRLLLDAMTGDPHEGSLTDLLRSTHALLADRPRLLVVGPTEHFSRHTATLLCGLFENAGSKLRLLLVGQGTTEPLLDAAFGARITTRVRFGELAGAELDEAVRRLHPTTSGAATSVIELIDSNYAHGRLRAWANVAAAANAHTQRTGEDLNKELAVKLLGRLGAEVSTRRRWGNAA